MKLQDLNKPISIAAGVLTLGFGFLLAGCSSNPFTKPKSQGADTVKSINNLGDAVTTARIEVVDLQASLGLLQQPTALAEHYKKYSAQVKDLEKTVAKVDTAAGKVRDKSNEYFAQWQHELTTMQNANLKAESNARLEKLRTNVSTLLREYDTVKATLNSRLADYRDVRTVLGTDLTSVGVDKSKSTITRISKDTDTLNKYLNDFAETVTKTRTSFETEKI